MAKDPQTNLNMSEFIDALERGKRTYEGFKCGLEIANRLANYEQVERELLSRVDIAKASATKAEADACEVVEKCEQDIIAARGRASRAIETVKQEESAKVEGLRSATLATAGELNAELVALSSRVEDKKRELADLAKRSVESVNEIRKIEKQLENVREAKRALLEA